VTAGSMNLQFPAVKLIGRNVLSARMINPTKNCSALLIVAINFAAETGYVNFAVKLQRFCNVM